MIDTDRLRSEFRCDCALNRCPDATIRQLCDALDATRAELAELCQDVIRTSEETKSLVLSARDMLNGDLP